MIVELLALIPLTVCEISAKITFGYSYTTLSPFAAHQSTFHKRL